MMQTIFLFIFMVNATFCIEDYTNAVIEANKIFRSKNDSSGLNQGKCEYIMFY